jgi:hypothetical protein
VTLQEYISSGIIESYVMGMANEKDAAEFEQLCRQFPELQEARIHFENTLEETALQNAVPPPPELKQKIWKAIQDELFLRQYIKSGIIECYVMGMANEKESAEFEKLCQQHPSLQQAREQFEITLEQKALVNAVAPPAGLKQKIWSAIQADMASSAKVVPLTTNNNSKAKVRRLIPVKWAVAASIALVLTTGYFVYDSEHIKQQLADAREKREQLEALTRMREQAELPRNAKPSQVKVNQPKNVPASIKVFWDSTNTSVYLVISDLVKLPAGEQYQLWSIKGGKYKSMGLFDAPVNENDRLIMKMDSEQEADSFAISIEKVGNKNEAPSPQQ